MKTPKCLLQSWENSGILRRYHVIIGVNPFDQPGVEAYKKNMFALLGKPGYEAQAEALRARL